MPNHYALGLAASWWSRWTRFSPSSSAAIKPPARLGVITTDVSPRCWPLGKPNSRFPVIVSFVFQTLKCVNCKFAHSQKTGLDGIRGFAHELRPRAILRAAVLPEMRHPH